MESLGLLVFRLPAKGTRGFARKTWKYTTVSQARIANIFARWGLEIRTGQVESRRAREKDGKHALASAAREKRVSVTPGDAF